MLKNKTCFIIGAGASLSLKFPSGKELLNDIWTSSHITFELNNVVESKTRDPQFAYIIKEAAIRNLIPSDSANIYREFKTSLKGMPSIDDFIETRKDQHITTYGKISIIHHIRERERKSDLYLENHTHPIFTEKMRETWLYSLWLLLIRGHDKTTIEKIFEDSYFIVFNYDRCIEEYFSQALMSTYSLDLNTVKRIMSTMNIVHPYGVAGKDHNEIPHYVRSDFGQSLSADETIDLSNKILTYSESINSDTEHKIQSFIENSEVAVILGFGFHDQNLRLMRTASNNVKEIYGTAYGESDFSISQIKSALSVLFPKSKTAILSKITCEEMMSSHFRGLALYDL